MESCGGGVAGILLDMDTTALCVLPGNSPRAHDYINVIEEYVVPFCTYKHLVSPNPR